MKKILIIATVALSSAAVFSSCTGGTNATPKAEMDSVAYAIGVDFANQILSVDSTLNLDMILSGFAAGWEKKGMTQQEAAAFLQEYFAVRRPAKAKEEGAKFLEATEKENANVKKTESGMLYEILEEGSDVHATADGDVVRVVYEGRMKDGKVFDSSLERGDTATFALNQVIKGWSEGMKLVGKGGKIKLWIPSELAYGEYGIPQAGIGPNEPLVFEVSLVDVVPAEANEAK